MVCGLLGEAADDHLRSEICQKIGPKCSGSGREIIMCTELGKPGKIMKNCAEDGGKRCFVESGKVYCRDGKPDSDKPVKFVCSIDGEYPDPFDCGSTYVCKENVKRPAKRCRCTENGFPYPDASADLPCYDLKKCPREVVQCNEGDIGEFHVNGEGTGLCYYCTGNDTVTSFPCGEQTNKQLRLRQLEKICYDLEDPQETTEAPVTTPKPRPPECEPPRCTDPRCLFCGAWRYPSECDCFYYECQSRFMIPVKFACRFGTHYNHRLQRCVHGLCDRNCPDCS